ncbi:hypothetical protein C8R43DRAFT_1132078 [Mycena crocata]|nr:hypothetical protein C8R43DRAFT_1132078 [Mycena crocata]
MESSKFPGSDTNLFYRAPTPSLGEPLPQLLSRSPSPNLPSAAAAVATVFGSRAPTPMYLPPPADLLHGLSVDLFVDPRDVGMPPPPSPFIRAPSRINSVSLQSDVGVTLPPQRKRSRPKSPRTALTSSASRVHAGYNILPPAKRQRTNILPDAVARYIDIEAQEDGLSDMEEDEQGGDDFINDDEQDDEYSSLPAHQLEWDDYNLDDTRLLEELAARYAPRHQTTINLDSASDSRFVEALMLLPDAHDPALWTVHARYGRENELIQSIMGLATTKPELQIYSAFYHKHASGRVYVEATTHLFFQNLTRNPYLVQKPPTLVPLHVRPELLRFTRHAASRSCDDPDYVGRWARWTKGDHRGDLVYVPERNQCVFVPRIPLGKISDDRVAATLFDPEAVSRAYPHKKPTGNEREYTWQGNIYQNGLRLSPWTYGDLTILDVLPTEAELKLFSDSQSNMLEFAHFLADDPHQLALGEGDCVVFDDTTELGGKIQKAGRIIRIDHLYRDKPGNGVNEQSNKPLLRMASVRVNQVSSTLEDGSMEHDERALPVCNLRRHLLSPLPPLAIDDRVIVVAGAQQGLMGYVDGIDQDSSVSVRCAIAQTTEMEKTRENRSSTDPSVIQALQSKEDTLLLIPMKCLQREFRCGDQIKVVTGPARERIGWIIALPGVGEAVVFEWTALKGILPDKESDLQKPTETPKSSDLPNRGQFLVETQHIIFHDMEISDRTSPKPKMPKRRRDVNLDFTGLEIRVTKGQLKGLRGVVMNWNETAPLAKKLFEKMTKDDQVTLATDIKNALRDRAQLRFKPSRSTQDINMDVMLTVRLENRPKLDQIPGHYVHELSSERTIFEACYIPRPTISDLLFENEKPSLPTTDAKPNQKSSPRLATPPPDSGFEDFDTPPSPTLILAAAKSIPVHPRPPSPKISPQDIRDQGKYCQWLLDKRLRHKRLDIRIEGLEQSNLFSKLGKKAQQQEGALGILVIQNTLRNIDTLIEVRIDAVRWDSFRLPGRCIKPMRTILRPPFERRKTPLIEVQTRVVVIGPDTSGSSSKIGEYAQTVPGETNDVVKVVFSGSVDRNVESGYYDMHSLCRSVNESMEWNSFPIDTTSFP